MQIAGWVAGFINTWSTSGKSPHYLNNDLFMAPRERVVWVNLYEGGNAGWYNSEEEARKGSSIGCEGTYTLTIKY